MKKDFNSGAYWDRFGRGLLNPEDRPETHEAADFIISLFVRLEKSAQEVAAAKKAEKIAKQQFSVFVMEVSNVARKYEQL